MSLDDAETNISKRLATFLKLPKAQLTPDKVKWAKDVADLVKKGKTFQASRDALNKRIRDTAKLADDLKKFQTDYSKFIADATKVRQDGNKMPDTPGRDINTIGNYLMGYSNSGLDDYP